MRTMLRWTIPVERGNDAIRDGTVMQIIESMLQDLDPEAAYFFAEDGKRSGMIVFDMTDQTQIPQIAEQLFMSVYAAVVFQPVINADDLRRAIKNV